MALTSRGPVFNSRVRVIAPDHGGNLRTQPDLSRSMLYARQLHRSCALLFEERPQPPVFVLFSRQNSNRDPPTSAAFHAINACPKAVGKKSVQTRQKSGTDALTVCCLLRADLGTRANSATALCAVAGPGAHTSLRANKVGASLRARSGQVTSTRAHQSTAMTHPREKHSSPYDPWW